LGNEHFFLRTDRVTSSTYTDHPIPPPLGSTAEDFKDLGFGAEVARGTRRRLVNRDGSFNVVRKGLNPLSALSLYHWSLTISWPKFLGFIAASYVAVNALFAGAYLLCGPNALQSPTGTFDGQPFYRAFFFSVDSFATIEALLNIVGIALATGVVFARFSRPTARIIYSRNAIVAPYRDITALEFRIANERSGQLIELPAKVILSRIEDVRGAPVRKFYDLPLERERVTFFALSWTVVHPITPQSPLYGLTEKEVIATEAELLILLTGTDETAAQIVHSRTSYRADEILWGARFASIFIRTETEGTIGMDVGRIHDVESTYTRIPTTRSS